MPTRIVTNNIDVIADGVRQGLGIGRLVETIHAQLPDQENFIPVMQQYCRRDMAGYLYFPQNSQRVKRIRVLIDFLVSAQERVAE